MKHCKGCNSKDNCEKYTDIMRKIDVDKCVCKQCLIKGMCKDPCDDFIKLFAKYYDKAHLTRVWWIKKYTIKMEGRNENE